MRMKEKTKLSAYLKKELVDIAKESGINISEICNDALESRLKPLTSSGKEVLLRLELLEKEGFESFPFPVKRVKLENIGKFEHLDLKFENGLNVLYGKNGSGKTTILKAIAEAYRFKINREEDAIKYGENDGRVEVKVEPRDKIDLQYKKKGDYLQKIDRERTVLLDNPVARMNAEKKETFVETLKKKFEHGQIILATHDKETLQFADNVVSLEEERREEIKEEVEELKEKIKSAEERKREYQERLENLKSKAEG